MEKVNSFFKDRERVLKLLKTALPYLFPILCFVNIAVFLSTRSHLMLDSDMSSELILGKLLAEEGGILSTNWYYSTELRVLNTQLVYKLLFTFTDDFHIVRYLGSLINSFLYALSAGYMIYQAGLKKYIPYVTGILLLPYSNEYFKMMLYASYYAPHLAISFTFLGMVFAFLKTESKKAKITYGILMGLLSFVSCLGGLRQLCILFVPLFGASLLILLLKLPQLLKLEKKELPASSFIRLSIISFASMVIGVLGYIFNQTVLRSIFKFHYFGGIHFNDFSVRGLMKVIGGFIDLFGLDIGGGKHYDFITVTSFFLFVFTIYAIISLITRHNKLSTAELITVVFTFVGFVIMVVIYTLTNFEYTRRYLLPISIFFIPVLTIYFKNLSFKANKKNKILKKLQLHRVFKAACPLLFALLMIYNSTLTFNVYDNYRPTRKLNEVGEIILLHDCYEGYATFWNANVLTELSNGKIEVRTWYSNEPVKELDRYHNWLHVKDFGEDEHEGKLFLLFTRQEYNETTLKEKLNYDGLVLNTDQHVLFIYDSMEDIFVQ